MEKPKAIRAGPSLSCNICPGSWSLPERPTGIWSNMCGLGERSTANESDRPLNYPPRISRSRRCRVAANPAQRPRLRRLNREGVLMAKFLRVGVHDSNAGGYTSKAWTIRRIGTSVVLKWGSVDVRGAGRARRIYWAGRPRQKTLRCGSEEQALAYVKKAIARRVGHRYERLLETMRIGLRPAGPRVEPSLILLTVLFVDIVRSTEKAARLGDRRRNEVLNHYYAALRTEVRASRGKEVTTTGDGILATFDGRPGATRAIRCA